MAQSVQVGASSVVTVGGVPAIAAYPLAAGGFIANPLSAADQGLSLAEPLYVSFAGPATLSATLTTTEVFPGQSIAIPANSTLPASVNAVSSGHKFSVVIYQPATQYPPTPINGAFPPNAPTGKTLTIPSYLYKEYEDDDTLQAFVMAYNAMAQDYVDSFNSLNLPNYTLPLISGALLDWVAFGLYGMQRPALSSGKSKNLGPFNTYEYNAIAFNTRRNSAPTNAIATTDDVFKRVLTWHFFKDDGKVFNVRWLKRRVERFLTGANGVSPNVDQTYRISVSFGTDNNVTIRVPLGVRTVTGGALFGRFLPNTRPFNALQSTFTFLPPVENALLLQEAIQSGSLELPFQFNWSVSLV